MTELATKRGWVSERLLEEFPRLSLALLTVEVKRALGRSPRSVKQRLAMMADRFRGADAVVMRQRPVPHAYRVFFRHIGLDPDVTRVPAEAAAVKRLLDGGFPSQGLLRDALTIAVMETGVPVWALDADTVTGTPGLRLSGAAELLGEGEGALPLPPGRIVVGDERAPLALLFGETAAKHAVTRTTRRVLLFAVCVEGVEAIAVDEALWAGGETLLS